MTISLTNEWRISFFAGYQRGQSGWNYIMGDFAQMALPLTDFAQLTVQRVNSSEIDSFVVSRVYLVLFDCYNVCYS